MAKRKRATPAVKKATKKATPANPKPTEPSAVNVNPMYDEMPDEIDDPANVFKMAMLDMKRVAVNNKLAFVAQDQEKKVFAAAQERDRVLSSVKAELRDTESLFVEQKQYIETKYGISLRSYTYNDETGILKKQSLPDEDENTDGKTTAAADEKKGTTVH